MALLGLTDIRPKGVSKRSCGDIQSYHMVVPGEAIVEADDGRATTAPQLAFRRLPQRLVVCSRSHPAGRSGRHAPGDMRSCGSQRPSRDSSRGVTSDAEACERSNDGEPGRRYRTPRPSCRRGEGCRRPAHSGVRRARLAPFLGSCSHHGLAGGAGVAARAVDLRAWRWHMRRIPGPQWLQFRMRK